ncbi:Hpt domain-containing protein [Notoacmeibacter ruber]|uniref:Hpt domain-containing protein n=1 Tax=Notoacmeibacter ruber TaxID=2670375 RepID=A0A3L7JEV5_9HYPH|nr:Hpt domain-containing protein [Notoacmeibacter ruber]RLQ88855.1 Hpt domain-containing protein [Notoacmeibacter ruber]
MSDREFHERLAGARRRFASRIDERLRSVEKTIAQGDFETARRILHNLAGAAPTFGFEAFGAKAREIEALIADGYQSRSPGPEETSTIIRETALLRHDTKGLEA